MTIIINPKLIKYSQKLEKESFMLGNKHSQHRNNKLKKNQNKENKKPRKHLNLHQNKYKDYKWKFHKKEEQQQSEFLALKKLKKEILLHKKYLKNLRVLKHIKNMKQHLNNLISSNRI